MPTISFSQRQLLLIGILVIVSLTSAAVGIGMLSQAAMEQQRAILREVAQSHARLIEAVAKFDARWSNDYPGGAANATLAQIRESHASYEGFGSTGEFTLARREGDHIVFMLSHRKPGGIPDTEAKIPWDSELAQPMRVALSGRAETLIGRDYRGEAVLAATEPIAGLDWGLVAKVDLTELRQPFVAAAVTTLFVTVLLATVGAWLFVRFTQPLIREVTESEARFRAIFQHAPLGIALVDEQGHPRLSNPALQRFLGRNGTELSRMSFAEFTHPDDRGTDVQHFRDLWAGRIPVYSTETRYLRPNAETVWGELTVSLIRDELDQALGAVGMVADISERRRMQQELTKAYEHSVQIEKLTALGSFAGGIAHEIKNPLMGLINYLDHVRAHVHDDALCEILERARQLAARIDGIVDGVLHYARGGPGQIQPTVAARVVETVTDLLRSQLAEDDIRLTIEVSEDLPTPKSDRAILEQTLLSVLLNAIHAVRGCSKRLIQIRAETTDRQLLFVIQDSGAGVPESIRKRIFDPFFSTKGPGVGTGLGLSVSLRNLTELGGTVTVGDAPGGGARFVIGIPLETPPPR